MTGDIAYLDEENYIYIVDRAKDIIIRGGENISCTDVENVVYTYSAVQEAAVFGLPDDRLVTYLAFGCCVEEQRKGVSEELQTVHKGHLF